MRIVAIGDIGVSDDMVHIGDEAMFEALVNAMDTRGVAVTGVSSHPAESASRYGIEAIGTIGWPDDTGDRFRRVVLAADGFGGSLEPGDPALAVIESIRSADGVVIAGGGNLSSLWGHHILERAALGAIARALGKPLVVTGQTIGPELTEPDAALVRTLLSSARLVGLREPTSFALCESWGLTNITQTVDDASYLVGGPVEPGGYCLVSLANHVGSADRDSVVADVAALLDLVATSTGLTIRFLAHFGSTDAALSRGDSVMHDRVIAAMTAPAEVVAPSTSAAAALLARNAGMVVSSRYHPVVFAVPAGVPAIGIPVDDYTTVKLSGALANFGQDGVLPVADIARDGAALVIRLWSARPARVDRRAEYDAWWDRVVSALG